MGAPNRPLEGVKRLNKSWHIAGSFLLFKNKQRSCTTASDGVWTVAKHRERGTSERFASEGKRRAPQRGARGGTGCPLEQSDCNIIDLI